MALSADVVVRTPIFVIVAGMIGCDVCTVDVPAGVCRKRRGIIQVTLVTDQVPDETHRKHQKHELKVLLVSFFSTTLPCTHYFHKDECILFLIRISYVRSRYMVEYVSCKRQTPDCTACDNALEIIVFTARRYASAAYAVVMCLSVRHKSVFY